MNDTSRISKMFGALVLGGGMLVTSTEVEANPGDKSDDKSSAETKSESPKPADRLEAPSENHQVLPAAQYCQLEFILYKYDRERVEPVRTCLDEKKDEEILQIIKEAKTKTCQSPFCGCWLG